METKPQSEKSSGNLMTFDSQNPGSDKMIARLINESAKNFSLESPETKNKEPSWSVTENPFDADEDDEVVVTQPQTDTRNGVVRVTQMLRQLNNETRDALDSIHQPRRRGESESEEERTDASVSRRSSGADSGVGIMSETEFIEHDSSTRYGQGNSSAGEAASSNPSQDTSSSYSTVPMAGLPLVGAMMGLCLGGPVGVLAGAKLGGVAAVGGSILGYTGAMVIKEQRELRTYIDDHYKREPDLYVLSPKDESILNRRMSIRTPPEGSRHLPGQRTGAGSFYKRGPAGYRRPSTSGSGSCSSLPASPALRRRQTKTHLKRKPTPKPGTVVRTDDPSKHPPHLVSRGQYRRLGDLTPEEQRSVLALICNQAPMLDERTVPGTNSTYHQVIITRGMTAGPTEDCSTLQLSQLSPAERRRQRANRVKARTSSLPDVLEEDCISVKSLTMET